LGDANEEVKGNVLEEKKKTHTTRHPFTSPTSGLRDRTEITLFCINEKKRNWRNGVGLNHYKRGSANLCLAGLNLFRGLAGNGNGH